MKIGLLVLSLLGCILGVLSFQSPFEIAANSKYFVDKTNFIKDVYKEWENIPYILITAPRAFCKTVNVDSVRRFFDVSIKNNQPQDIENSESYKLFKLKNLEITRDKVFFKEHFGKYPVIYVNLTIDPNADSIDEIVTLFTDQVRKSFTYHKWVLNSKSNGLSVEEKEIFEDIVYNLVIPAETIVRNIKVLAKALNFHFHQKVILIADDYDSAIRTALETGVPTNEVMGQLLQHFGNSFRDTALYVTSAIFTGIFDFAEAMGLTKNYGFSSYEGHHHEVFAKYYGLTIQDARGLLFRHNITDEKRVNSVIEYYDGYYPPDGSVPVLNPWSIRQYIAERHEKPRPYWAKLTGLVDVLTRCLRNRFLQAKCGSLFLNKTVELDVEKNIGTGELKWMEKYFNKKKLDFEEMNYFSVDVYLSFLYMMGYLTNTGSKNLYKVPNMEIYDEFTRYYFLYNDTLPLKSTTPGNSFSHW